MKESVNSLRWLFGILSFILLLLAGFSAIVLGQAGVNRVLHTATPLGFFGFVLAAINAFIGLYFAFTLGKYLNPGRVKYVQWWLLIGFGIGVVSILIELVTKGLFNPFNLGINALITWYLYRSVTRLAATPLSSTSPTPTSTAQ